MAKNWIVVQPKRTSRPSQQQLRYALQKYNLSLMHMSPGSVPNYLDPIRQYLTKLRYNQVMNKSKTIRANIPHKKTPTGRSKRHAQRNALYIAEQSKQQRNMRNVQ